VGLWTGEALALTGEAVPPASYMKGQYEIKDNGKTTYECA